MRNHLESDSIRALPPIPSAIVVRIRRGRELKKKRAGYGRMRRTIDILSYKQTQ